MNRIERSTKQAVDGFEDIGTICNWMGHLKYETHRDGRWRITDLAANVVHEFADGYEAAEWALQQGDDGDFRRFQAESN